MRLAILDCDPIIWMAAYINKDLNNEYVMFQTIDQAFIQTLIHTKADKYVGFMQGSDNSHRHKMFPDYKANRPSKPDWFRLHEPIIRDHLLNTWKVELAMGQETDDCIASVMEVCKEKEIVGIVCSIDKDFNQLEGEIYNPKHKETTIISALEAEHNLAKQILMGDSTDNIRGLPGIGQKKAQEMLDFGVHISPLSPLQVALEVYTAFYGGMQGLIEFSQTAIKITLKRDKKFVFNQIEVPDSIKALWDPQTAARQLI